MRVCNVCKVEKNLEEYHKCAKFPLGRAYTCKICAREKTKAWAKKGSNKEKKKLSAQDHYQKNKETYKARARESNWAKKNPERIKAWQRAYYKSNPEGYLRVVERRRRHRQATPPWLSEKDKRQIKLIYLLRYKVTQRTGKMHHVDHIVPLQGKNVCGLHVPWNLQILPEQLNLSKGNSFDGWNLKEK